MNTNKLRYIVAVDRYGSMSAAATAIHVSQPSLTRTVAELERELGFALFERRARGMRATDRGRHILDRASRILADLDQLGAEVKAYRQYRESQLRLCVAPPPFIGQLNPVIPKVLQRFSTLKVDIKAATTERAISLLRSGDTDLVVGPATALRQLPDMKTVALKPFAGCCFVRRQHPLIAKKKVTSDDLIRYPLVVPERYGVALEITGKLPGSLTIPADHQLHIIGHFPLVCEVVAETDAVGFVGQAYRQNAEFLKRFAILPIDLQDALEICCAYRADIELSAPERMLIDVMM